MSATVSPSVTPAAAWPGPRLLVPITVDALVLGQPNMNGQQFVNLTIPYATLSGEPSVTPMPFGTVAANALPNVGVNLVWTLPYGLRSGATQPDGSVAFPLVPNRWTVLRSFVPTTGSSTPQLTAFVLESDFIGAPNVATSAYPDPDQPGSTVWIGRRFDLGAWDGSDQTPTPFLRAVGPGDVAFTAAYQNLENVFALYDQPSDTAVGAYSYVVAGWYSPISAAGGFTWASDPLLDFASDSDWSTLLSSLLWQLGDGSATALAAAQQDWAAWQKAHPAQPGDVPTIQLQLASQTMCHGAVTGLQWKGSGQLYPQQMSQIGQVDCAVGNNATEAIGAWLGSVLPPPASGSPSVERLVEAFQSGLITQFTDDPVAFETSRHDAEFGTHPGDTVWTVAQPRQTGASSDDAANQSVPLDATATALLVSLNAAQANADGLERLIVRQQSLIYWLWYLVQSGPDAKIQQGISQLQVTLATTQASRQAAATQATALNGQLVNYLAAQPAPASQWVVKATSGLTFDGPNDPVVLIAGTNLDDKLTKPGAFDDGSSNLITRFSGQTVTGLTIEYGGSTATLTSALVAAAVALPTTTGPLPPEVTDLWLETLLLDPSADRFLAQLFFQNAAPPLPPPTAQQLADVATLIAAQQTLPTNAAADPSIEAVALAAAAGISGVLPEPLSLQAWTQPWTPLSIDWQVTWYPSPSTIGALDGWTLGEIDYEWSGTSISGSGQTYVGRTLLNPQSALGLQQQLQKFIDTSPSYGELPLYQQQELQEIVATIGQWDIITQPLGDLAHMMLMQMPTIAGPVPDDTVATSLGAVDRYQPMVTNPFQPIRAGHLLINRLWVVDVFGQRISAAPDGQNVAPVIAEPLLTSAPGYPQYLQLPPRLAQSSRLDFALLQADDDAIRTNSSDATSAVCGYLAPNYLDGSLTVFDAAGNNQGEVQPITIDTGSGILWNAVPGSSAPLGAPPQQSTPDMNAHVLAIVSSLLGYGNQGVDALGDLLAVMDGTQWITDPNGAQEQGNLNALIGRPLAVVRASLALGPDGLAANDCSFAAAESFATSGIETDGFTQVVFDVRIGDLGFAQNGVVGYFLDDDYTRFYAVYGYEPVTQQLTRALFGGGAVVRAPRLNVSASGDGFLQLDGLVPVTADGAVHHLTILASPRAAIPAISGALPTVTLMLAPGPTTAAFDNMSFTFRAGPLLTSSAQLRMPLPADIRAKWSWVQRTNVTTWSMGQTIAPSDAVARIVDVPMRLQEGWLDAGALEATPAVVPPSSARSKENQWKR
jgi:hypothetical protein